MEPCGFALNRLPVAVLVFLVGGDFDDDDGDFDDDDGDVDDVDVADGELGPVSARRLRPLMTRLKRLIDAEGVQAVNRSNDER